MEIFYHKPTTATKDQQQFQAHKKHQKPSRDWANNKQSQVKKKRRTPPKGNLSEFTYYQYFTKLAANVFAGNLLFNENISS
jgi:hypothetical protein